MNNIVLETKLVGEIKGHFHVPAYQRGYRWSVEVNTLLDDVNEVRDGENYCLQPIVVKRAGDHYELIDGQQRLTTIFLVQKYIRLYRPRIPQNFTIDYEIRTNSADVIKNIDFDNLEVEARNIDEQFIYGAARRIKEWFEREGQDKADDLASSIQQKFNRYIRVIWYEVGSDENSIQLFTRLNIGKIPLANAELVRALFLSRSNGIDERKQLEIATQWDLIEKQLHNDSFWYFITNERTENYPARIELLFNLMANKNDGDKEKYRTFFYFNDLLKKQDNKPSIWTDSILRYFQQLAEWYEDFEIYHKVGYLITVRHERMQHLLKEASGKEKSKFHIILDDKIAESLVGRPENEGDVDVSKGQSAGKLKSLSYEKETERSLIFKTLLLFNVETIRQKGDVFSRFPFERHKKEIWTVEHIHAQNSQGLNRNEARKEWLESHKKSLNSFNKEDHEEIIERINLLLDKLNDDKGGESVGDEFNKVMQEVVRVLSAGSSEDELHTISNLALLSHAKNAALNNSTFDVKRNKILEMDKTVDYIPICTRHVFLKYYTPSEHNQLHFWSEDDRKAYLSAIQNTLKKYLPNK